MGRTGGGMAIEYRGFAGLPFESCEQKQQLFIKAFWPWLHSNTLDCWRAALPMCPEGHCLDARSIYGNVLKSPEMIGIRFNGMIDRLKFAPPYGPVVRLGIDSWKIKLLQIGLDAAPLIPGFIPNVNFPKIQSDPLLKTVLFLEILDPAAGEVRLRSCFDGKLIPWKILPAGIEYFLGLQRSAESRVSEEEWENSREAYDELCSGLNPVPSGEDLLPLFCESKNELQYDENDPFTCRI